MLARPVAMSVSDAGSGTDVRGGVSGSYVRVYRLVMSFKSLSRIVIFGSMISADAVADPDWVVPIKPSVACANSWKKI